VDDVELFSADEQRSIIAAPPDQAANMARFAFWSGLRTSACEALDWSNADW
jgi:integrase